MVLQLAGRNGFQPVNLRRSLAAWWQFPGQLCEYGVCPLRLLARQVAQHQGRRDIQRVTCRNIRRRAPEHLSGLVDDGARITRTHGIEKAVPAPSVRRQALATVWGHDLVPE